MTKPTLLNNIDHAELRVALRRGARWGHAANRVRIFPTEFAEVQREYPILFGRDEQGQPEAFALLGLDRDENLFLDGARWNARYLPALFARGPFSIGLLPREGADPEPMIHVDLDDARVGDAEGERLFLTHGGNAPLLDEVARVLERIHVGHAAQAAMFDALAEAGLIEPVRLEIMLDDSLRYDLVEFETVSADGLSRLSGAALERLHAAGWLGAAFHVAASIGNVQHLIALKNQRRAQ